MSNVIAGVFYMIGGVFGTVLNLFVAYLITNDKSMNNATYKCMTQLAFGEAESLLANMFIPGIVMMANVTDPPDILLRLVTFMDESGFRATNYWMVLISFSRWMTFAHRQMLPLFFNDKRHIILCLAIWIGVHAFHSPIIYYRDSVVPGLLDYDYTNSTYSQLLNVSDWFHDVGSALIQVVFQAMTVAWIVNMRKQIISPEMRTRNKNEVRLFIQCSLDSFVYCSLIIVSNTHYVRRYSVHRKTWVFHLVDVLLFFNHIDCAVFYFCFNRTIRRRFVSLIRSDCELDTHTPGRYSARLLNQP